MAAGKQHKEKFYHFQDNSYAKASPGAPFSAAAGEGGGAAKGDQDSGGAGWQGGSIRAPSTARSSIG